MTEESRCKTCHDTGRILASNDPDENRTIPCPDPDGEHADEARAKHWWFAALTIGYNEIAKQAPTLRDKVYFRLYRDECERQFIAHGGYPIINREGAPVDTSKTSQLDTPSSDGGETP